MRRIDRSKASESSLNSVEALDAFLDSQGLNRSKARGYFVVSDLILARRDGAVFEVTLNRPRQRNAINDEMMNALSDAFDQAERRIQPTARGRSLFVAPGVYSQPALTSINS